MLVAAGLLGGCRPSGPGPQEGGIRVVASFYPLYEAARQVSGQGAVVQNLVPPGTESHDFEPTPRDTAELYRAAIVMTRSMSTARP